MEHGEDINKEDEVGDIPLFVICIYRNEDII